MAQQQWQLRVRGKQRASIKVELLVAAVVALGEQLQVEQRAREQAASVAEARPRGAGAAS